MCFLSEPLVKILDDLPEYLIPYTTAVDTTHAKASAAKRLRSNGLRGTLS